MTALLVTVGVTFLVLPVVCCGSYSVENGTEEEDVTWASFQKLAKSRTREYIKFVMPYVIRGFSDSNISSACEVSVISYVIDLARWKSWAVKMIDASGKIPSGILEGTVMDFGSYDMCIGIKVKDTSRYTIDKELFRGRYCMVGYHSPLVRPLYEKTAKGENYVDAYGTPPEWAHKRLIRAGGYLKRTALYLGTCVPSTCTEDDIRKVFSIVGKPLGFNVSVSDCHVDEPFVWPSYSVAAVACLGCLASLCVVGTVLDSICRCWKCNPTDEEADHVLLRILKAFSLLKNTESLFGGPFGGGSLSCFNGIRFLSATWIILGHTYFYTDTWKYLKYRNLLGFQEQFSGDLSVAFIENFTIPVTSFFFLSGFLLVYTTWRVLEKSKGKLNLLVFVIHKIWRMTPALGLTLALFFAMPIIDSGPIWNSSLNPPLQNCLNLWWANFLFIQNWWNTEEFCLIHTWYLAALMQFHIVGVVLLLITFRWPVFGIFLGSMLLVGCAAITVVLVVLHNFPMPAFGLIQDMDLIEEYNSRIYNKPFAHFSSYLIGMVLGYIMLKYRDRKVAPKYQAVAWVLAITVGLLSAYGIYGPAESVAVRAFYIAGHRIGWALSVGWLIYACATGAGGIINRLLSWSAMYPLGQLSYLIYLIHPLVIIYRNASLRERVYYGQTELVFTYLSTITVTLFLSYVGYIAVEIPFAILEKMVFKKKPKADFNKIESKENGTVTTSTVTTTLSP